MKKLVLFAVVLAGLSFPTFAQEEVKEEATEATTESTESAPAEEAVVVEVAE
ncbi:MAG: hypothetical protein LUG18_01505 [Candidatus Azobacteroides sp.]|nr:hypothetical protein [Candidatus Azobacteroides sp.]